MSDNTPQDAVEQIATDELSFYNGVDVSSLPSSPAPGTALRPKVQRTKVGFGVDGTYDDVTTANPLPVGTELPAAAALSDSAANPTTPTIGAANLVYNGTTWERARVVGEYVGSTGIPGVGVQLGQNNGNSYPVWNANHSDGQNGEHILAGSSWVFNGATWERARTAASTGIPSTGLPASGIFGYNQAGSEWIGARMAGSTTASGLYLGAVPMVENGAGNVTPAVQPHEDSMSAATGLQAVGQMVFNGATWDRARSATAVNGAAWPVAGLAAVASYIYDPSGGGTVVLPNTVRQGDAVSGGTLPAAGGYVYNGASWDRVRSGGADAAVAGVPASGNYIFNGTTWDRVRAVTAFSGAAWPPTGLPGVAVVGYNSALATVDMVRVASQDGDSNLLGAGSMIYNGASWDRARSANSDTLTTGVPASGLMGWNGATWERLSSQANGLSVRLASPLWTPSDSAAAPGSAVVAGAIPMVWDTASSVYRRIAGGSSHGDGNGLGQSLVVGSALYNGASWDRLRGSGALVGSGSRTGMLGVEPVIYNTTTGTFNGQLALSGDGFGNAPVGAMAVYNGASWDRARAASAAAITTGVPAAGLMVRKGGSSTDWSGMTSPYQFGQNHPYYDVLATHPMLYDGNSDVYTPLGTANSLADGHNGQRTSSNAAHLWDPDLAIGLGAFVKQRSWGGSDGIARTGLAVAAGAVFNGSTWDRVRSGAGDGSASTGYANVVGMLFNETTSQYFRPRSASADGQDTRGTLSVSPTMWDGTQLVRARGDATNGLDVDVTRVQGTVTVDTELPAAAALADGAANPTPPTVGAANLVFNGTTWDRVRGDVTNGLDVDVTRLPALPTGANVIGAVTQSGTWTADTELPVAAALADSTANPTVPAVGAFNELYDGSNWQRQRGTTGGAARVAGMSPTAGTGTITATGTAAAITFDVSDLGAANLSLGAAAYTIGATAPTLTFEASDDGGTTWFSYPGMREDTGQMESTSIVQASSTKRIWTFACPGINRLRVYQSAGTAIASGFSFRWTGGTLPFQPDVAAVPNFNGRTPAVFTVDGVVGVTPEALATVAGTRANTAVTGATTQTVPTGKQFVVTHMSARVMAGAANVVNVKVRLRANYSGAATATSPVYIDLRPGIASATAVANEMGTPDQVNLPDGALVLPSGASFGISQVMTGTVTSTQVSVLLIGYEIG